MSKVARDHSGSSGPNSLLKLGSLRVHVKGVCPAVLQHLQQRLHPLSDQSIAVCGHPYSKVLPHTQVDEGSLIFFHQIFIGYEL